MAKDRFSNQKGTNWNPVMKYSADSMRFNLMSLSAPNSDSMWSDRGMDSAHKFLVRVYSVLSTIKLGSSSKLIQSKTLRLE